MKLITYPTSTSLRYVFRTFQQLVTPRAQDDPPMFLDNHDPLEAIGSSNPSAQQRARITHIHVVGILFSSIYV